MKVWRLIIVFAVALSVAMASAPQARASDVIRVLVRRQPDAPLRLDDCKAYINDTDVGNVDYYLDIAADYTNVDPKNRMIDAVRLRFDLFDDFYDSLRTVYGDDSDPISGGQSSRPMGHDTPFESFAHTTAYVPDWEFINTTDTARNLICSVDTVRFDDGTIWQAPPRPFTPKTVGKAFAQYMRTPEAGDFYTVVSRELIDKQTNP